MTGDFFKFLKKKASSAISLLFLLIMSQTGLVPEAAAQSNACHSLQLQLGTLSSLSHSAPSQKYLQYDRAVRDQSVQLKKTERAWKRNGCLILPTNKCRRIKKSLSKMRTNLSQLKNKRNQLSPGGGNIARKRERIINAMHQRGCIQANTQQATVEQPKSRRRTLLEQIFGVRTYSNDGYGYNSDLLGLNGSTFRTLCVRTCDGYYFPVSFSTSPQRFQTDADSCQSLCPGTDTELFFHTMPNGDAETAISYASGEPYTSLANAFSYRKSINNECSCRLSEEMMAEIAGTTEEPVVTKRHPIPTKRVDQALDLETIENQQGNLNLKTLAQISKGEDYLAELNKNKKKTIRLVGPTFFPVQ